MDVRADPDILFLIPFCSLLFCHSGEKKTDRRHSTLSLNRCQLSQKLGLTPLSAGDAA